MTKILFVCHGNICRSPMAERIFNELARRAGCGQQVQAASAATSSEEIGNGIYPPARAQLAAHGVPWQGHRARRITARDYDAFDYLVGMDRANIANMQHLWGGDAQHKIHLLLDFAQRPGQPVADPWYTGDFERAWLDILAGCQGLLEQVCGVKAPTL